MEHILLVLVAVLGIAAAQVIGPRLHVAPPLLLVVAGAVIGVMPFVPAIDVDPEWILVGVLPPLLYSAAVSMPTMDFRRDFTAISALSVVLVLVSAVVLGFFFAWVIPGLPVATGIALGAIVSPTDAVATAIAKRLGVPQRVTAVLEGESLLNDATALVLLRAAVAAVGAGFSFGHVALSFAWAVVGAVIIGGAVGLVNLWVRRRLTDATVNTAISFTVPYLAFLPAEELGASGLVAAVTAGLITGAGAAKYLSPQHRLSDSQNWRTVELLAEGGVFLLMGLELWALIVDVRNEHGGLLTAVWIGLVGLCLTLLIRAVYVTPLIGLLARRARRGSAIRPYLEDMGSSLTGATGTSEDAPSGERDSHLRRSWRRRPTDPESIARMNDHLSANPQAAERFQSRITRRIADIDYYTDAPMGPKEGTIIVWAGMRGVVTLAAAQTLPPDTASRALLVLIAFVVAAASLLVQGGTLGALIRALRLTDMTSDREAERERLEAQLRSTAGEVLAESGLAAKYPWIREQIRRRDDDEDSDDEELGERTEYREAFERIRREIINAQRAALLRMRDEGTYDSSLLTAQLRQLDAQEISLDMRSES